MVVRGGGPERLVRAFGSVLDFPRPACMSERRQVESAGGTLPELAADRTVAALDAPVALGTARRQDIERDVLRLTGRLEPGHEFRPAIDLDRHRQARLPLVVAVPAVAWRRPPSTAQRETTSMAVPWRRSTPGAGRSCIVSRWTSCPGSVGLAPVRGDPRGVGARRPALADPYGMGLDQQRASLQASEDAPDGGHRETRPLIAAQVDQFGLAGARDLRPQVPHRLFLCRRPLLPPGAVGPARAGTPAAKVGGIVPRAPAIDRRPAAPDHPRRIRHAGPVGMLQTAQPVLHLRIQLRPAGQPPGEPGHPVHNAQAAAQPALLHPTPAVLALRTHEGISLVIVTGVAPPRYPGRSPHFISITVSHLSELLQNVCQRTPG
jgi:hypothetical protein